MRLRLRVRGYGVARHCAFRHGPCGIGFTMSLFIGELAFRGGAAFEAEVKLGVLGGSLVLAIAGIALLRGAGDRRLRAGLARAGPAAAFEKRRQRGVSAFAGPKLSDPFAAIHAIAA